MLLVCLVTPVAAAPNRYAEADVDVSDVTVTGGPYYLNQPVVASGTVTIVSEASGNGKVWALSNAGYSVTNPDAVIVASGSNFESDVALSLRLTTVDAGQIYEWETTFTLDIVGYWTISHYGGAIARWTLRDWGDSDADTGDSFKVIAVERKCDYNRYTKNIFLDSPKFTDDAGDWWKWSRGNHTYMLLMPTGVTATPEVDSYLRIKILNGKVTFMGSVNYEFSQPVVVYELVDGVLVEVARFTKVVNGIPQ